MHVEYTGRHVDISPEFRQLAEKKLAKLDRLLNRITDVNVILTSEKGSRCAVDMTVLSPNLTLNAVEEGHDDIEALNAVVARIMRQAQRHTGKRRARKRRAPARATALWAGIMSPWPTTPPGAGPNGLQHAGGEGVAAAPAPAAAEPTPPRVVKSRRFVVRTMSVSEAAREVEGAEEGFVVFRESDTNKTHVIYRRKDGTLGLIEPEA
jgi:putative sigma-54 modulation protein